MKRQIFKNTQTKTLCDILWNYQSGCSKIQKRQSDLKAWYVLHTAHALSVPFNCVRGYPVRAITLFIVKDAHIH